MTLLWLLPHQSTFGSGPHLAAWALLDTDPIKKIAANDAAITNFPANLTTETDSLSPQ